MACPRKRAIPEATPDAGRILVANGSGGSTSYPGLVYNDVDGDGTLALGVLGDVEARSFRQVKWANETPVLTNTGSVLSTWSVTGTIYVGQLAFTTAASASALEQISVSFPYSEEWLANGWTPFVNATLGGGSLLGSDGGVFARATGTAVEVGVFYPAPSGSDGTGTINYTVTLVAL